MSNDHALKANKRYLKNWILLEFQYAEYKGAVKELGFEPSKRDESLQLQHFRFFVAFYLDFAFIISSNIWLISLFRSSIHFGDDLPDGILLLKAAICS